MSLNAVMASVSRCHICVPHTGAHLQLSLAEDVATSVPGHVSVCVLASVWNLNKLIRCIRHILAEEEGDASTSAFRTRNQPKVKGESACGMPHTVC